MGWTLWIALALIGAAIWSVQMRLKRRKAVQAMSGWPQLTGTVAPWEETYCLVALWRS